MASRDELSLLSFSLFAVRTPGRSESYASLWSKHYNLSFAMFLDGNSESRQEFCRRTSTSNIADGVFTHRITAAKSASTKKFNSERNNANESARFHRSIGGGGGDLPGTDEGFRGPGWKYPGDYR